MAHWKSEASFATAGNEKERDTGKKGGAGFRKYGTFAMKRNPRNAKSVCLSHHQDWRMYWGAVKLQATRHSACSLDSFSHVVILSLTQQMRSRKREVASPKWQTGSHRWTFCDVIGISSKMGMIGK
jgi:hypothetical protein